MRRAAHLLAAVSALLLLGAGCTPTSAVPGPATGTDLPTSAPTTADLKAQKKAAGIADCPTSDPSTPALRNGLPDVVLQCLGGGREVRLAGLRGEPMIVSIWAQWCEPCRAEAPHVTEVAAEASTKVRFLGIDFDDPQPGYAIEFAQLSKWRYPQLVDQDKVLAGPLQISGPPQTFFVRADGTIAYRQVGGFRSADQIRDLAREHLGVAL